MLATAKDAFPSALKSDAAVVAGNLTNVRIPVPDARLAVVVDGERVAMPGRVYFDEVKRPSGYSDRQLAILDCLQTRHHDGFVRERALRRVMGLNTPWSAPFVIQLVAEYVIEILDLIEASWAEVDESQLRGFLAANPRFHDLVRQRVASYWNVYYRDRFWIRDRYVGFRLLRRLDGKAV